jgi:creatinine amidohydrolase
VQELRNMTWTEIAELDPARSAVVMVVGPTEQHGPHLPLGTDVMVAEEMARRMIHLLEDEVGWTVVMAPMIAFVPSVLSRSFPGSVSVRKQHYQDYVTDVLASFAENGLRHLILISTHIDPPFVRATQAACRAVNETWGVRAIHGYERFPLEDVMSGRAPEIFGYRLTGDVHAGILETSSMLVARPELVRRGVAAELPPQPVEFDELARLRSLRDLGNGLGYTGYPALGEIEYGKIWFERYGRLFGDVLRRYAAGEDVTAELALDALTL